MGVHSGVPNRTINAEAIRITPEFLALIAEIDEFKGAWRALGSLAPERLSAPRRVATTESTLDDRLYEPYGVRTAGGINLGGCWPNRVKANCLVF